MKNWIHRITVNGVNNNTNRQEHSKCFWRFTFVRNGSIMVKAERYIYRMREREQMIRQNIVFIENKAGSLQKVTELLKEAGIDIYGFACFDAPEFALFRMVTDNRQRKQKESSQKMAI